jgi:hypothetical protein
MQVCKDLGVQGCFEWGLFFIFGLPSGSMIEQKAKAKTKAKNKQINFSQKPRKF